MNTDIRVNSLLVKLCKEVPGDRFSSRRTLAGNELPGVSLSSPTGCAAMRPGQRSSVVPSVPHNYHYVEFPQ